MITDKHQHPEEWLRPASESSQHYSTPEGYLEGLADAIMERIDSEPTAEHSHPTHWWVKAKPLVYLAACFVGLMLTFSLVQYVSSPNNTPAITSQETEELDDEWAIFYSEYADGINDYDKDLEYTL